jgi:O-antigen ligase
LIGAALAPGAAFSYGGRLTGALWPIPPTQVAHYSAVLLGCTAVLWFGRAVRGRTAAITVVAAMAALIGAHTRTALLAMTVGLVIAGASMFVGNVRVRRTSALLAVSVVMIATFFAPFIMTWLWRGQSLEEASQLTGRTKVWTLIVDLRRPWLEEVFGSGLSNKSFNGLPIDNNWLAVYLDQGWFGIFVVAALLLLVLALAVFHPRSIRRALALFLVVYCAVASVTETGLGDASPYVLELTIAAALLARPAKEQQT